MSFLALVLLYGVGSGLSGLTASANADETPFRYVYLVGTNGNIEKLDSQYKTTAASDLTYGARVEDADILPGGKKIVLAVWSDPPFEVVDTDTLERISFKVDLSTVKKGTTHPYFPKFIRSLSQHRFYYDGWPEGFVVDIESANIAKLGKCQANAKDDLFVSPDRKLMLNLSKDGTATLCDLADMSVTRRITGLFPEEHSWIVQLNINWEAPSLDAVYVLSVPERRALNIRIEWPTGKVEKSDAEVPASVARILNTAKGKEFLFAYARGVTSDQTLCAVWGSLAAALSLMKDNSLANMPRPSGKYPLKAYLSPEGRIAAFVVFQDKREGTDSQDPSTVIFIDLATGTICHRTSFPEPVIAVLFD